MSDLILSEQITKEIVVETRMPSVTKKQLKLVKPVLLSIVYGIFIVMSLQNNNLFLTEMLVSGGIIAMLYFVHILSQKQ